MLKTLEDIGRIVRNALIFNPRNWGAEKMNLPAGDSLVEAVRRLFELLEDRQVAYALVSGVALLHYVEGRNTEDIDLVVAAEDLQRLPEIEIAHQDVYFARGRFRGLQINFLFAANPLFQRVLRDYVKRERLFGHEVSIATVEGLLLQKLYALPSLYRQGDFGRVSLYEGDIAALIYRYEPHVGALLDLLAEYVGEGDLQSLREIVGGDSRADAPVQARALLASPSGDWLRPGQLQRGQAAPGHLLCSAHHPFAPSFREHLWACSGTVVRRRPVVGYGLVAEWLCRARGASAIDRTHARR